jgi:putative transposase
MPRTTRRIEAGLIYHVLNRDNGRRVLFSKDADFAAFVKLLAEAVNQFDVDLLAWCLMPNHWHLLLRPHSANALSRMMAWMTVTHARRHHRHYPNPGTGHLYQGRFKSFPVQDDEHFLIVARYIHANPQRAGLVKRARDWRWSDLGAIDGPPIAPWPIQRPPNWTRRVESHQNQADQEMVETSIRRGAPFGSAPWVRRTAERLNLASALNPRGRPKRPVELLSPKYRRQLQRTKANKSR